MKSGRFILQRADRKDYGTDCEVEVVEQGQATNVWVHVQLKGTERVLNADGSLSIEVSRSNLNYLPMDLHSFYVAQLHMISPCFACRSGMRAGSSTISFKRTICW
jgi:hypothetical protein